MNRIVHYAPGIDKIFPAVTVLKERLAIQTFPPVQIAILGKK
jgi:hypothetical protein